MPLSIKKSIGRGKCSPFVRSTCTNGLKSTKTSILSAKYSTSSTKIRGNRKSSLQHIRQSLRQKSLCCKRCGVPLKPTNLNNTYRNSCKCRIKLISANDLKNKSGRNSVYELKQIKNNSKGSTVTRDYTGDDFKLRNPPVVAISSVFRMLAETAAMKLRKGARIGETNKSIQEEDESTEDSSSEFEDSSEEEVFEPAKTYPLRKKQRLNTPAQNRRISSGSSDSSSESLPDLDFPIDQRWSVPKKDNVADVKKIETVSNGTSEVKRDSSSISRTMGSSQTKTARNPNDDKSHPKTAAMKQRSLRSTDGSSNDRSNSRPVDINIKGSLQKSTKPQLSSSHSSPDRNSNRSDRYGSSKPSSSHEIEKSYSLRCLEKKDNCHTPIAESAVVEKHNNETPCSSLESKTLRRSRGRPRKVPKVEHSNEEVEDNSAGTSKESTTPLTRSQRRAARLEPHYSSDQKLLKPPVPIQQLDRDGNLRLIENEKRSKERDSLHTFKSQNSTSMKHTRDAIALRAKQSKIIAKSRVWQCNRNNSALKTFQEMKKGEQNLTIIDEYPSSTVSAKNFQSRAMLTLMRGNGANKNQLQFRPTVSKPRPVKELPTTTALIKKQVYPKAKCELCNMTFTRRFSLTKHYMTIQHKKMVQEASKSGCEELRALAKSVPVLVRQHRDTNSSKPPAIISMRPNVPSSSRAQDIFKEETADKSEFYDESNNIDYSSDSQTIIPDEMNDSILEDNFDHSMINAELPPVQEWVSGEAIGKNEFVCNVCDEKFTKKRTFSEHLFNHREDADLKCSVCQAQFTNSDDYNRHIDQAHLIDTKFSCKICASKFIREDYLDKHMQSHKRDRNEKFVCSNCDKRFSAHNLLLRHFDSKHLHLIPRVQLACDSPDEQRLLPKIPEFIVCDNDEEDNDDDTPTSSDDIDPEYRDQMPDIDLEMEEIPPGISLEGNDASSENDLIPMIAPEDYSRELPVESFNRYKVLGNSKKKISIDFTKLGCGYKSKLPITFSGGDGNNFVCIDCGKLFQNRRSLLKHVDYLSQSERYSCQICKMKFKFKNQWSRHQQKHIQQKDLMRPHSAAVRKPSFLKHHKLVARKLPRLLPILPNNHELNVGVQKQIELKVPAVQVKFKTPVLEPNKNVNPKKSSDDGKHLYNLFTCELCSESFTEKHTLSVHTWFHQKENVYSCPDCEARCERKSDLDLHYKCHETQQPFFLCYVCFKPFRWKKDMVRHVRKKHPAEKTYRCLYCPERFRKNDELTLHISKRHPEHRSFPCEYCGRRYAQKRYLLVHIQTQHGIEPVAENILPIIMQREVEDEEVDDEEEIFLETDSLM